MSLFDYILPFLKFDYPVFKIVGFVVPLYQTLAIFLSTPRNIFLISLAIILFVSIIYSNSKINAILKDDNNLPTQDSEKKEYQLYLLFIGLLFPFIEILFDVFEIRPKSLLVNYFFIGFFFLLFFLISEKSKYFYDRIRKVFIFTFYLYFFYVAYIIGKTKSAKFENDSSTNFDLIFI